MNNNQQAATISLESGIPSVGSIVWAAGRTRAQQAINLYANLDYLRPYFDVEPREVLQRLIRSIFPRQSREEHIKPELYGPSMIVFSLAAILIYQMKLSSHAIQDGTLIGASFVVCFGYWIGSSFALSSLFFVLNTQLSLMQILSVNGYALFSHCIVLFLATFIHTGYDHVLFYGLWAFVGGLAAIRMALIIMSRTVNPRYRPFLGLLVIAAHMFYLLYLHFAYHTLAETVAHALNDEAIDSATKIIPTAIPDVTQLKDIARQVRNDLINSNQTAAVILGSSTSIMKA